MTAKIKMHILRAERQWCLKNNVDGYFESPGKSKKTFYVPTRFEREGKKFVESNVQSFDADILGQAVFGHFGATRRFPDRSKN